MLLFILIFLICLFVFGWCLWKVRQPFDLKLTQMALREYFKDFDYICNTHNIQYWAEGGTLLGAVREKVESGYGDWKTPIDYGRHK